MTETKNPFMAEKGYSPNHDIAIVGYGITLDTAYHFLRDHNIDTEATDELDYDDWQERLETSTDKTIDFYQPSNLDVEFFIHHPDLYADENDHEPAPTKAELDRALVNGLTDLFTIPESRHNDLTRFVNKYAGGIFACDYS